MTLMFKSESPLVNNVYKSERSIILTSRSQCLDDDSIVLISENREKYVSYYKLIPKSLKIFQRERGIYKSGYAEYTLLLYRSSLI